MKDIQEDLKIRLFATRYFLGKYLLLLTVALCLLLHVIIILKLPTAYNPNSNIFYIVIPLYITLTLYALTIMLSYPRHKRIAEIFKLLNKSLFSTDFSELSIYETHNILSPIYPLQSKINDCKEKSKATICLSNICMCLATIFFCFTAASTLYIFSNMFEKNLDLFKLILKIIFLIFFLMLFIQIKSQNPEKNLDMKLLTFFLLIILLAQFFSSDIYQWNGNLEKTISAYRPFGNQKGALNVMAQKHLLDLLNFTIDIFNKFMPIILLVIIYLDNNKIGYQSSIKDGKDIYNFDAFFKLFNSYINVLRKIEDDEELWPLICDLHSEISVLKSDGREIEQIIYEIDLSRINNNDAILKRYLNLYAELVKHYRYVKDRKFDKFKPIVSLTPKWAFTAFSVYVYDEISKN